MSLSPISSSEDPDALRLEKRFSALIDSFEKKLLNYKRNEEVLYSSRESHLEDASSLETLINSNWDAIKRKESNILIIRKMMESETAMIDQPRSLATKPAVCETWPSGSPSAGELEPYVEVLIIYLKMTPVATGTRIHSDISGDDASPAELAKLDGAMRLAIARNLVVKLKGKGPGRYSLAPGAISAMP